MGHRCDYLLGSLYPATITISQSPWCQVPGKLKSEKFWQFPHGRVRCFSSLLKSSGWCGHTIKEPAKFHRFSLPFSAGAWSIPPRISRVGASLAKERFLDRLLLLGGAFGWQRTAKELGSLPHFLQRIHSATFSWPPRESGRKPQPSRHPAKCQTRMLRRSRPWTLATANPHSSNLRLS